ncbi:hypothetical protein BYT27DRAFT_6546747 [Phlegmacium glaucopus]|nr:hypothetical protein BYT27DRAFT_6546747 [Phlegmacium glaucopus]
MSAAGKDTGPLLEYRYSGHSTSVPGVTYHTSEEISRRKPHSRYIKDWGLTTRLDKDARDTRAYVVSCEVVQWLGMLTFGFVGGHYDLCGGCWMVVFNVSGRDWNFPSSAHFQPSFTSPSRWAFKASPLISVGPEVLPQQSRFPRLTFLAWIAFGFTSFQFILHAKRYIEPRRRKSTSTGTMCT